MVTQHNTIHTSLSGHFGILSTLNTFQHNLSIPRLSQPLQVIPAQTAVDITAHDSTQPAALFVVYGLSARHGGVGAGVCGNPFVGFAFARDGSVDCDEDGRATRLAYFFEQGF